MILCRSHNSVIFRARWQRARRLAAGAPAVAHWPASKGSLSSNVRSHPSRPCQRHRRAGGDRECRVFDRPHLPPLLPATDRARDCRDAGGRSRRDDRGLLHGALPQGQRGGAALFHRGRSRVRRQRRRARTSPGGRRGRVRERPADAEARGAGGQRPRDLHLRAQRLSPHRPRAGLRRCATRRRCAATCRSIRGCHSTSRPASSPAAHAA